MFLPSPWPSGRPSHCLSSFRAALLREFPSRLASCRMALSRSWSNPRIVSLLHAAILSTHLVHHYKSDSRLLAQRSSDLVH